MTWRMKSGNFGGGTYGVRVSKPGIDVTTAVTGQFLVDTTSVVYQSVLSGDTAIFSEGSATVPAGTYTASVTLPAAFAPYSNLAMLATYYMVNNSGVVYTVPNISNTYLTFHVTSGVLYLNLTFRSAGGTGTGTLSFTHRVAYSVFRGAF